MGQLGAVRQGDGDGVVRVAVQEVGRAVERVDNPPPSRVAVALGSRLRAEDGVVGEGRRQGRGDGVGRLAAGGHGDVAVLL